MAACREDGFAYAGLIAPSSCLCGSAGEDLESKTKLSDETCIQGCSGMALQACGKEGVAAAIYDGKISRVCIQFVPIKVPDTVLLDSMMTGDRNERKVPNLVTVLKIKYWNSNLNLLHF